MTKRAFDLLVASFLGVVALPFAVTIAIGVWLDTRSAILFASPRIGLNGKVFRHYR